MSNLKDTLAAIGESDQEAEIDFDLQFAAIRKNRGDTASTQPRVELVLVELDLKIRVPPEQVNFSTVGETES